MTFDEIVAEVMDRLNLTSDDALARIRRRVNDRYRRVTSSVSLETSRRSVVDVDVDPTASTSTLPDLTIPNMEKILKVSMVINGGVNVLRDLTFDEVNMLVTRDGNPSAFGVKSMGSKTVTIRLDGYPHTTTFTLTFDGIVSAVNLHDNMEPAFAEDFHDILVEGAMSDELRKMEKPQLAQMSEAKYDQRLSDLRMFIAKSGWHDIYQGKNKPSQLWYRPWYTRISVFS
jgi:hypothetical protein